MSRSWPRSADRHVANTTTGQAGNRVGSVSAMPEVGPGGARGRGKHLPPWPAGARVRFRIGWRQTHPSGWATAGNCPTNGSRILRLAPGPLVGYDAGRHRRPASSTRFPGPQSIDLASVDRGQELGNEPPGFRFASCPVRVVSWCGGCRGRGCAEEHGLLGQLLVRAPPRVELLSGLCEGHEFPGRDCSDQVTRPIRVSVDPQQGLPGSWKGRIADQFSKVTVNSDSSAYRGHLLPPPQSQNAGRSQPIVVARGVKAL